MAGQVSSEEAMLCLSDSQSAATYASVILSERASERRPKERERERERQLQSKSSKKNVSRWELLKV